jgi:hypothetical protein
VREGTVPVMEKVREEERQTEDDVVRVRVEFRMDRTKQK